MTRRGLGWRKSRAGIDPLAHHLLAAKRAAAPLPTPDLVPYCGPILDQGQVGSCVAFALTRALQISWQANGGPTNELVSPRQLYWDARAAEYDPGAVPEMLDDTGSEPRLMMSSAQALGVVPLAACPYSGFVIDNATQPAPSVYLEAYDQRGLQYALVTEVGLARVQRVADALRNRMPVCFGMYVDAAFEQNTGRTITSIDMSAVLGGHDLCIVRVNPDNSVRFANSWTQDWGDHGFGTLSLGVFGDPGIVSDVYILSAAPIAP